MSISFGGSGSCIWDLSELSSFLPRKYSNTSAMSTSSTVPVHDGDLFSRLLRFIAGVLVLESPDSFLFFLECDDDDVKLGEVGTEDKFSDVSLRRLPIFLVGDSDLLFREEDLDFLLALLLLLCFEMEMSLSFLSASPPDTSPIASCLTS